MMDKFFPFMKGGWQPAVGFLVAVAAANAIIQNTKNKAVLGSIWGALDNAASAIARPLPDQKK